MAETFKVIITHEYPDLDSILSIYLLRKYGKQKYPGVEKANVEFYPAGSLPNNRNSEDLEKDGILAVDTGGGRFDTHPIKNEIDDSKIDKCASTLVAEDLGLYRQPELEQILIFSRLQDIEGRSLKSRDIVDHAFSLPNIITGLNLMSENFEKTIEDTGRILDSIIATEKERCSSSAKGIFGIQQYRRIRIVVYKIANNTVIKLMKWKDKTEQNILEPIDMDSILSIYLLRKYGINKYPELDGAILEIHSVESLQDEVEDRESNQNVLLSVDTGYIMPTVPAIETDISVTTDKRNCSQRSASSIIADELSLNVIPELAKFLAFTQQIYLKTQTVEAMEPVDRVVSIFNILYGFNLLTNQNFEQITQEMEKVLDAIIAQERDWCEAVMQYANAKVYTMGEKGKIKVVAIEAESGTTIKVSRWKDKADLTIYRHPTKGHVSILVRRNGPLHNLSLAHLAKIIRTAEATDRKERVNSNSLNNTGEINGWFMHSSEKILSKGSPKATKVVPTRIPFEVLTELILGYFNEEYKIPDRYCPIDKCIGRECLFYLLKLSNCYIHRDRLEFKNSLLGKRLDQNTLEQLRKLKHK